MKPGKLSASSLFTIARTVFSKIPDHRVPRGPGVSLTDAMMSGLAVFSLKYSSLLAFDQGKLDPTVSANLGSLFGVNRVPSDTQMRKILDDISPTHVRSVFKKLFSTAQRAKVLEKYSVLDGRYIVSIDGTGYFSSNSISCANCCSKKSRSGTITYYHQMLAASIVHPDLKQVIPLAPEAIIKQDGTKKNDCERNTARRMLNDLRREHPHLNLIVVEDGIASNGPHIRDLMRNNMRYILGAKPGDHKALFEYFEASRDIGLVSDVENISGKISRKYSYVNALPLNDSNQDLEVNFIHMEETKNGKTSCFSWVSDVTVTDNNVEELARIGRSRWKIENETFNTLKNQGYQFEHNFGHGDKNLSTIFAFLMMTAFLIDQLQEIGCSMFKALKEKCHNTRSRIWERLRAGFFLEPVPGWKYLYTWLSIGRLHAEAFNSS